MSYATFTAEQNASLLYHLGCPSSGELALSYGGVLASEAFTTIQRAIERVPEAAKTRTLTLLSALEVVEQSMMQLSGSAEFSAVGDLVRNAAALPELRAQYAEWQDRLASHLLGAAGPKLLAIFKAHRGGGSSINGTWSR